MPEEERTFELKNERIEYIQEKIVKLLQEVLEYDTNTEIYISFIDKNANPELQKGNKIVICQTKENITVLVKGNMSEIQNDIIWSGIEKAIDDLRNIEITKKKEFTEEELAKKIVERIIKQGFTYKLGDAKKFIANFKKKFNRVPKGEEVESIGIGYINMLNEKMKVEGEGPEITSQEEKIQDVNVVQNSIKSIEPEKTFEKIEDIKKSVNGILDVKRGEGRRTCPKCGNQNINAIKELIDKKIIISNYPMMYGKKF
ncbi:MAG TPA: hypothetical protein VGB37_15680, partial [Candidatus Lokiarchaeia archaeon]